MPASNFIASTQSYYPVRALSIAPGGNGNPFTVTAGPCEKIPVTVVIPIKDEAPNLPACLGKLHRFAQVLVVHSGSTDGSIEIAEQMGAQVLQFDWDGRFPKKRNWVLRHYEFQTEWVLFLDADEQATPEFVRELERVLPATRCNGFWLGFQNYFMGRLLRHGDQMRKLALLRLGHGEYERIDEERWSALDMEVHEHLQVRGPVGEIKPPLIHNDFKGLHAYYERHNHYSSWKARRFLALQNGGRANWTRRQKLKYRLLRSPLFPLLYFLGSYGFKGGFRDGAAGLRFSLCKAFYFYQVQLKIEEARARGATPGAGP